MIRLESEGHREPETIRRPKLLFLAYPFPPMRKVACIRTWNTAKYLARLRWEVTVVTPTPSVWRNVDDVKNFSLQLEKEKIHQILTDHRWRFLDPEDLVCSNQGVPWFLGGVWRRLAGWMQVEPAIGWIKSAEFACASLTSNDVDVILATGSPFLAFSLAKRLSSRLGRPYVLDYRDPWSDNPHVSCRPSAKTIQEEKELLAGCAAATVVSRSWADSISRRFGVGAKLHVITNGYDPEELTNIEPKVFEDFAIVYAGRFYPPKRVITPLISALKRIKEKANENLPEWHFHYYGSDEAHVLEVASKMGVQDHVVLHGNVPRSEALAAVRGANIAVVLTSVEDRLTEEDAGIVPGKLFETLGLRTTTLIIAPPGADIEEMVKVTGLAHQSAGNNVDDIESFILSVMSGRVPRAKAPEIYEWGNIVNKLHVVLLGAATGKGAI